jgi:hypothetical protein
MYGKTNTKSAEPSDRTQVRLAIIKNLAALAKQGKERQILMLRVDYRKRR